MNRLDAAFSIFSELSNDVGHWVRTMNDTTYLGIMFVGAVTLTFVIARALR